MAVVALTGGIAAGKSAVTDVLSAEGITVIDADQVARDVVAPGQPALIDIEKRFGPEVITAEGGLDREALGQRVFADDHARSDLNAIVHPAVWEASTALFQAHQSAHPDTPLVYAVPLLAEGSRAGEFDLVVLVHAPAETRYERLREHRGYDSQAAHQRVDAQATDAQRHAIADVTLDAGGELEHTREGAVELANSLWQHWPDQLHAIARQLPTRGE